MRKHAPKSGWLLSLVLFFAGCSGSQDGQLPFAPPLSDAEAVGFIASKLGLFDQLDTNTMTNSPGQPSTHSSDSIADKVPDEPGTDIVEFGVVGRYMSPDDLSRFEMDFPEGQGPNGFTVHGDSTENLRGGFYFVTFLRTIGNIAIGDNGRLYQFGAVFDRDNDPSNNYVASPSFPNDTFRNSDTWLQFTNDRGVLGLTMTDAQDNNIQPIVTRARAIIRNGALFFMYPAADLPAVPCYIPQYRVTAFCHGGMFGLDNDWSGSARPHQSQPLAELSTDGLLAITSKLRLKATILGVQPDFLDSLSLDVAYSFVESPPTGNGFSNGHGESIILPADDFGGKDGGLNVLPRDAEKGTLLPCLRGGSEFGGAIGGFVGFPVPGMFDTDRIPVLPAPATFDDGLGPSIDVVPTQRDPLTLFGATMDQAARDALIEQAAASPGGVVYTKEITVFDGQIAEIALRNEMANVSDLRDDFRLAVEAYDPGASFVRANLPLHVYPHIVDDRRSVMLDIRPDTRSVTLEVDEPVSVDGVDHDALVPFNLTGGYLGTIEVDNGLTLVMGRQRDPGETEIRDGLPILREIPVLNRLFADSAEIKDDQVLLILLTAEIILPGEE